ncbi:TetR/AcrR family transcriptional regulator [Iodobacter sp.]|uniref:TetR/AcrR family transcriptional regulator n=1 Tax=Iodobacter sp. TaxID=1915058 RepID=UPI0025CCF88D|nr:TetR/AcrR family transcriptional regulator [Iodobacter sp.]
MAKKKHEDTREHLLAVGESVLRGKGFTAVGLAEILATAEVPKGSFYHYFPSKEHFGCAVLERYFALYQLQMQALEAEYDCGSERLMHYWQGWLMSQGACHSANQCMVVKLSAEVADLSEPMREVFKQGTSDVIDRLASWLDEPRCDGALSPDMDAQSIALMLYQMWLGASLLTKIRQDSSALDTAMQTTCHLLGVK